MRLLNTQKAKAAAAKASTILSTLSSAFPGIEFNPIEGFPLERIVSDGATDQGLIKWCINKDSGWATIKWLPYSNSATFANKRSWSYDTTDDVDDTSGFVGWIINLKEDLGL